MKSWTLLTIAMFAASDRFYLFDRSSRIEHIYMSSINLDVTIMGNTTSIKVSTLM